jgi:hypothetical protein
MARRAKTATGKKETDEKKVQKKGSGKIKENDKVVKVSEKKIPKKKSNGEEENQKNGDFYSQRGITSVAVSPARVSGSVNKRSLLKVIVLKHINSWCILYKVDGHSWCDKLFSDDVKNREKYLECAKFPETFFYLHEKGVKLFISTAQRKDIGIRLYASFVQNKPNNDDLLFLASNLCKGFNNRSKRNNQTEHSLETDQKHLFFFESTKPKRWTDVIGDVDALSLLCDARPNVSNESKL